MYRDPGRVCTRNRWNQSTVVGERRAKILEEKKKVMNLRARKLQFFNPGARFVTCESLNRVGWRVQNCCTPERFLWN